MFFSSKKVIGLDIGTSTIKIAELAVGKNEAQIISFGFTPTPQGAVVSGEIANSGAIGAAVHGLMLEIRSKRQQASVGMWGTSVIVKKITIPRVDRKLIADQLRWEAEQYIPFDINDISLAHHIIENNASPDTMDILLIAAQNEMVRHYTTAVVESKLKLAILDVSGFALANLFEFNYGRIRGSTIALLNIGAGNTNFVVVSDGEVIFCRDIPIGGANYSHEIQKELGVTFAEAEALKLGACVGNEAPEAIQNIIGTSNDAMTEEIRNGFDFFSASSTGITISRCYYSGGASRTPGLIDKISKMAHIPLEPMNPFLRIKPGKKMNKNYLQQVSSFAPIALGLGLRKVGDK